MNLSRLISPVRERWRVSAHFMSWREGRLGPLYTAAGRVAELGVWAAGRFLPAQVPDPDSIRRIFVLRNNDIGDMLVTTPLFEALRRRFPSAQIVVGAGKWTAEILKNNPHISEVITLDAPWYNHFTEPRRVTDALRFVLRSPVVEELKRRRFDLGIDILGSHFGMLLLIRAGIRARIGVRGYAGGHSAASLWYRFNPLEHVSRANLRVAELLGATDLPDPRPQLFLSEAEKQEAEARWPARASKPVRIAMNIGGKPDKIWPRERMVELAGILHERPEIQLALLGGPQDVAAAAPFLQRCPNLLNGVGALSLRQTFAMVWSADVLVTNDSMLSHAAAAFEKPTLVLLSNVYASASRHAALWGYPPPYRMVGKEGPGSQIATPVEAMAELERMLLGGGGVARYG